MTRKLISPVVFLLVFMVALVSMAEWAIAGDTNYQRLPLKEGLSIEVPSHWLAHSDAEKRNFAAAGEGASRMAGLDYDTTANKSRVLAVSALPTPTGAKIRVNIIRPLAFSGADLRAATAQDLKDMKTEFSADMAKVMTAMGGKLLTMETPRVETVHGHAAILIEYRRSDLAGPSPWTVRLYRIPAGDKLIELTMSFRESDAGIWRPILEYVKRSLRF